MSTLLKNAPNFHTIIGLSVCNGNMNLNTERLINKVFRQIFLSNIRNTCVFTLTRHDIHPPGNYHYAKYKIFYSFPDLCIFLFSFLFFVFWFGLFFFKILIIQFHSKNLKALFHLTWPNLTWTRTLILKSIHALQITGTVVTTPNHIHAALSMTSRETGLFPCATNGYEVTASRWLHLLKSTLNYTSCFLKL